MKLKLHWQIVIALVLGIAFGALSRQFGFQDFITDKVAVIGTLFRRALQMIIVPLIVSSIISGVTSIGTGQNMGRMGLKTFGYYVMTSLLGILVGLFFVNLLAPGIGATVGFQETPQDLALNAQRIGDTLIGIIPTNPFTAMVNGDMLPTIFFSLIFGFFVLKSPEPHKTNITEFFDGIFAVMMKMTQMIIVIIPIGVFALIANTVAQAGFDVFLPLATYMVTVILALVVHAFVTLPLLLFIGGINPLAHAKAMSSALLTAFSTASSGATLPLTIKSVEDNAGVSNKTASFVLPLGATINMDGTALYECVAAIFIAQAYGMELTMAQQFIVVLTALLASIGAAAVPMAGLVMITIVLGAIGLPLEGVGLIIAVDRVLDMMRTTVNVWSDSCGAVIIAKSEGENGLKVLRKMALD